MKPLKRSFTLMCLLLAVLLLSACVVVTPAPTTMSTAEQNMALVRRYYEEVIHQQNFAVVDELFTPDFIEHTPEGDLGLEHFAEEIPAIYSAFPDLTLTIEDIFATEDRVAVRWTIRATHQGEFFGVPATGKQVTVAGIDIIRIEGSKIAENWEQFDLFGWLTQLGAIPASEEEE